MDIDALRRQVPALRQVIYLNTGWAGPRPRPVLDAIVRQMEFEAQESPTAPHVLQQHKDILAQARAAFARLLGTSPDEIALTQSTTEGINLALNGLRLKPGERIVTCNLEHPSVLVPCYHLRHTVGVEVEVVQIAPADDSAGVLAKFEAALQRPTRLVALSYIAYCTGRRLPLQEICDLAHQRGALVLVDGVQAFGQIPVDMRTLGCDFYAVGGQKWLLGPDGVGAVYIRRDLLEAVLPTVVGPHAALRHDAQGAFVPNTSGVNKFDVSTTSIPLWAGLIAAAQLVQGIGLEAIQERIAFLTRRLRNSLLRVPSLTFTSPASPADGSGLVAFAVEGVPPKDITEGIWQRVKAVGRTVNYPPATRLCAHAFNTEDEIDWTAQAVFEVATIARNKGKAQGPSGASQA
ncbi:MAG: aminotransferase class V-fold PLP-dependent enzyme [Chloroflexi bacterium]|nr:aminotransferase class V-fold PLP-dependent enzyme [Chloroflexota bacterium]